MSIDTSNLKASRRESVELAAELGADDTTLQRLASALRLRRRPTVVIPRQHLETLSRGSGWCRKGRGTSAEWGTRVDDGYEVGPGLWVVCGKDGFSREKRETWKVEHIPLGDQIWTIAN